MEKTAMQLVIEWMDTNSGHCSYGTIRKKATELLATEKRQIVEAVERQSVKCSHYDEHEWAFKDGEQYYTQTFEQNS